MTNRERVIENAVIKCPEILHLDYVKSSAIRNLRLHPDKSAGRVDVLLIPKSGEHKLVLVECKVFSAKDAGDKCVGQLLKYLAFALRVGDKAIEKLRDFSIASEAEASSEQKITPKRIMNARSLADTRDYWSQGNTLDPSQVGLFLALDGPPKNTLTLIVETLKHFGLQIGIVYLENGELKRYSHLGTGMDIQDVNAVN